MMKITHIHIKKFRGFVDEEFSLGSQLTAIVGQNGTQKSTLLGIITQTFTISKNDPMREEKPLCGGSYISAFNDKFRLSPTFDKPKEHEWTIFFDNGEDFTVESIKRTGSSNIRFWKKGAREEGDGYISLPTIFLSLKRLVPLAEENKISTNDDFLSQKELSEFKDLHNRILISQVPLSSVTSINSTNKQTVGVSTNLYDWNQNSMGQDNLGKIILALFSFQRLKDKYPNHYQGGILAIDELDATMFPASQVELLNVFKQYASALRLQIIFTTHSTSLIDAMDQIIIETSKKKETNNQVKTLFLRKVDNRIKIEPSLPFKDIFLNLNVITEDDKRKRERITVYTEDKETIIFVKAILKRKASVLEFVDSSFSCSNLIELAYKKVPAFCVPHSIIFLDGDVKTQKENMKKIGKCNNILSLPSDKSPERAIASYLFNLSDEDKLWNSIMNGYTKQVCFRRYSKKNIDANRETAKKWFNEQLKDWGRNGFKVFNPFFATIPEEVQEFKDKFEHIIHKYFE